MMRLRNVLSREYLAFSPEDLPRIREVPVIDRCFRVRYAGVGAMATLTPFDQATLLTGITNPTLRGGICVALSDRWLAFMKESRLRTPQERLAALRAQAGSAMLYQDAY